MFWLPWTLWLEVQEHFKSQQFVQICGFPAMGVQSSTVCLRLWPMHDAWLKCPALTFGINLSCEDSESWPKAEAENAEGRQSSKRTWGTLWIYELLWRLYGFKDVDLAWFGLIWPHFPKCCLKLHHSRILSCPQGEARSPAANCSWKQRLAGFSGNHPGPKWCKSFSRFVIICSGVRWSSICFNEGTL